MAEILTPAVQQQLVTLIGLIVVSVLILAYRAGVKYLRENLGLKIDDQHVAAGEQAIRDAVAAIDADSRRLIAEGARVKSEDKQQRALELARRNAPNGMAQWSDDVVRTKLDAEVERVNRASLRPPAG
jgi:hypothetical protein